VCRYDSTAQAARCFCYDDWIEADCQTPRTPFPAGAVAGAVIGGMIIGALGVLGYAFYKGKSESAKAAPEGFY
jgi:hypothetical protein